MIKLRNILLHDTIFIIILLIVIYITIIRLIFDSVNEINSPVEGVITNYNINGNKLVIDISKYKIRGTYYIKTLEEKEYLENTLQIGDKYKIEGDIFLPDSNSLFNYKNYLKTKNINYLINIKSINKLKSNNNFFHKLKNIIIRRLNKNSYLNTFLLGDKSYLDEDVLYSYQENGISHLFAISGMHITLLSSIILKVLKRLRVGENKRFFITSILLILYLLLVGFSPSILRGVLFFILFSINNIYYFYIKNTNLFMIALSITLLINPYYIYDTGFIYSFTISLALLLSTNYLNSSNYFISLLKTSYISFISSLPITLYNNCSINILSIIYNLFFVPFVSIIIFPLSLIVVFIPILLPVYNYLTSILESTSLFLTNIPIGKFIFMRLHISIYIILFIIIFILIKYRIKFLKYIFILLIILYFIPNIISVPIIKMIDVGQGDSILLYNKGKTILIDTGGITKYYEDEWMKGNRSNSIVKNRTVPILKSLGIKRIDFLLLTHGDFDHLGETLNLLKYYKVDRVVINSNYKNYLEREIEKVHEVEIGVEGYSISVGGFNLIQLNEDLYDENDSSQIYYVTYKDKIILLTGDASKRSEYLLLDKYDLGEVDILKVGHHGSKTSTSDELLEKIRPKFAIISCGLNNKFNHPNIETINKLKKHNIPYYRTDLNGNITIYLDTLSISTDF